MMQFAPLLKQMELLKMRQFCQKYGIGQYILTKRLKDYDHIYIEGKVKPRIIDNEKNAKLAKKHSQVPAHRPRSVFVHIDEFCKKYGITQANMARRWKCIEKTEIDGQTYIADSRNNMRHCGIL